MKVAELDDFPGFGEGWSYPDDTGIWTEGCESVLAVSFEGDDRRVALALGVDGACVGPADSVTVAVLEDGECLARREFRQAWWHMAASAFRRRRLDAKQFDEAVAVAPPDVATVQSRRTYHRRLSVKALHRRFSDLTTDTWRIELPSRIVEQRGAELRFTIDAPHRPIELGWSNDKRQLGIHLHALTLRSARSRRRPR